MSTEESTWAQECTCAPGDSTDRFTVEPDTTDPGESRDSVAMPTRPAEPCTDRAGGHGSWLVRIGHCGLYRLNSGSTEIRSMWAS